MKVCLKKELALTPIPMKLLFQPIYLAFKGLDPLIFLGVYFRLRGGIILSRLVILESFIVFRKLFVLLDEFDILLLQELKLILDIFQISKALLIDPTFL